MDYLTEIKEIERIINEESDWVGADLSKQQIDWLNKIRNQFGRKMIVFTLDYVKDAIFVDANNKVVRINKVSGGGLEPDTHHIRMRRDDGGKIIKHRDDIADDEKFEKDLKKREKQNREKYRRHINGVYVDELSQGTGTRYKFNDGKWYRPDGKGGWLKHTRKKGHPSASELTDMLGRGKMIKVKKPL